MNDKLLEQFFDFEVFPNWWCCVIGRYPQDDNIPETIKDDFIVVTSKDSDCRRILMSYLCDKRYCCFGYNNKRYDNIIFNGIVNGFSPRQIKILNDIIIDPEKEYEDYEHMRIAPFAKRGYRDFTYQDMMDDNTGSLKEKESCMCLDIRETTVPFNKEDLTDEDIDAIIYYCKHDVWSSMQFYKIILKPFVASKLSVGKYFNIPMDVCYKSTNAKLAALALDAKRKSFDDKERIDIELPKELKEYITYALPADVVKRICSSPEKFDTIMFGNIVSYSNGGIHSVPLIKEQTKQRGDCIKMNQCFIHCKSGDGWSMLNVDAGSFYPNLMVAWKTLSRSVPDPNKFAQLIKTRLDLKSVIGPFEDKYGKNGKTLAPKDEYEYYVSCKEQSQAIKLILNTTFGASGNKYLDLYDPYMQTCTCRLGQLLLTALANNLYMQVGKNNMQILQTNTDGILIYVKDEYIDLVYKIGDEWSKLTRIPLEFENEHEIWQRDVNNYIMGKKNGLVKTKGGYFVTDMQQPGYNHVRPLDAYVCREAMIEYIAHGKDIVEYIAGEKDLSKFVITCHKGTFSGIVRSFTDGRPDEVLHKVNRCYASLTKEFGMIYKIKKVNGVNKKYKAPDCPEHCGLLNDAIDKYDYNTVSSDIDYMWYINKTYELLSDPWFNMDKDKIYPIKIFSDNEI